MSRLRELNEALDGLAAEWGVEKRYERSVLLNDAAPEIADLIDAARKALLWIDEESVRDLLEDALAAVEAKLQ